MKGLFTKTFATAALLTVFMFGTFGTYALAGEYKKNKQYVVGTVESIDLQKNTFTVVNREGVKTVVVVAPDTEFEIERSKRQGGDIRTNLAGLKKQDWVKVKMYQTVNDGLLAKEVDIHR